MNAEIPTRELLGVKFALTDYDGALRRIDEMVDGEEQGYLCLTSVHGLMESSRDLELAAILNAATLNLPDGMPVVWALNLLSGGKPLDDRVYGPTLMERACERAAAANVPVYLYGGHDEAALRELKTELRRRAPQIEIAGAWSPPHRELTDDEEAEAASRIDGSGAKIVWCGISTPRQEKWVARMRPLVKAPVLVSVGAAFDFLAGRVSQAPGWMQSRGLEWAYRMAREPRRLGPRYLRSQPRLRRRGRPPVPRGAAGFARGCWVESWLVASAVREASAGPADADVRLQVPADDVADPELSIVIPALNEELTIADFVDWCQEGLRKAGVVGEILIVDSSDDRTAEIALARGARVLRRPSAASAAPTSTRCPSSAARYVLMGDADCTYDFRELAPFVERFREGYEFVMGSRWKGYIEPGLDAVRTTATSARRSPPGSSTSSTRATSPTSTAGCAASPATRWSAWTCSRSPGSTRRRWC